MTTAAKPKPRNLTPKQWAEVEALWESGEVIYDDLVAKYGKSQSTFERHFKKHGVVKGAKRAATKKAVEEKLKDAAVDEAAVTALRIRETKESHYKMATSLAMLIWNEILTAKQNSAPYAVAMNNLKALDTAMSSLKKAREERYAILGLDRPDAVDPDELPELIISELTAEQIDELRQRDIEDQIGMPTNQSAILDRQSDPDDEDDDGVVET